MTCRFLQRTPISPSPRAQNPQLPSTSLRLTLLRTQDAIVIITNEYKRNHFMLQFLFLWKTLFPEPRLFRFRELGREGDANRTLSVTTLQPSNHRILSHPFIMSSFIVYSLAKYSVLIPIHFRSSVSCILAFQAYQYLHEEKNEDHTNGTRILTSLYLFSHRSNPSVLIALLTVIEYSVEPFIYWYAYSAHSI